MKAVIQNRRQRRPHLEFVVYEGVQQSVGGGDILIFSRFVLQDKGHQGGQFPGRNGLLLRVAVDAQKVVHRRRDSLRQFTFGRRHRLRAKGCGQGHRRQETDEGHPEAGAAKSVGHKDIVLLRPASTFRRSEPC